MKGRVGSERGNNGSFVNKLQLKLLFLYFTYVKKTEIFTISMSIDALSVLLRIIESENEPGYDPNIQLIHLEECTTEVITLSTETPDPTYTVFFFFFTYTATEL